MHKLQLFCVLGSTRRTRKTRMRDNVLASAEALHKRGLDSRIPFLKSCFTNEGIQNGSTARRDDGIPVPDYQRGQILTGLHFTDFDSLVRFNIFNAENRLQAVPSEHVEGDYFKIVKCKVRWIGDLRLAYLNEDPVDIGYSASYVTCLFQIFMRPSDFEITAFLHETEHARHFSLLDMSGFYYKNLLKNSPLHAWLLPHASYLRARFEYLANLRTLMDCEKNIDLPYLALKNLLGNLMDRNSWPHLYGSCYFVFRLASKYDMKISDIMCAMEAIHAQNEHFENHPGYPSLQRMRTAEKKEYELTYESTFGLPIEDIQDIIANLPMI